MTDHHPIAKTTHEKFMQAATQEMDAFEHKECEFRKRSRKDKSEQLEAVVTKRKKMKANR